MRLAILSLLLSVVSSFAHDAEQIVMDDDFTPAIISMPTLEDLLTVEPSASIFFSYARELTLSSIFHDKDARSSVLVPINKAVMQLPRKPHQGSSLVDEGNAITEEEFDNLSKAHVQNWVTAHIIPQAPIEPTSRTYSTLNPGKSVRFTFPSENSAKGPEWSRVTVDDGIRVLEKREACNGDLYLIDGSITGDS